MRVYSVGSYVRESALGATGTVRRHEYNHLQGVPEKSHLSMRLIGRSPTYPVGLGHPVGSIGDACDVSLWTAGHPMAIVASGIAIIIMEEQ